MALNFYGIASTGSYYGAEPADKLIASLAVSLGLLDSAPDAVAIKNQMMSFARMLQFTDASESTRHHHSDRK